MKTEKEYQEAIQEAMEGLLVLEVKKYYQIERIEDIQHIGGSLWGIKKSSNTFYAEWLPGILEWKVEPID